MKLSKAAMVKLGIVLAAAAFYLFAAPLRDAINQAVAMLAMVDVEAIKAYILSFGLWAPIVSFLLMVLQSLAAPLPAFVVTFANAALFGWVKGAALSWTSAMAGAVLCFYLAKFYGRGFVERFVPKIGLEEMDRFFLRYGKYAILIARLLPFISFDIVSYAAGLTSMGFWEFFWATGLGQLPATIIYSYAGDMLVGGARSFVFGLLILFSVSVLVMALRKYWLERKSNIISGE